MMSVRPGIGRGTNEESTIEDQKESGQARVEEKVNKGVARVGRRPGPDGMQGCQKRDTACIGDERGGRHTCKDAFQPGEVARKQPLMPSLSQGTS